jgi:hypothetical protein
MRRTFRFFDVVAPGSPDIYGDAANSEVGSGACVGDWEYSACVGASLGGSGVVCSGDEEWNACVGASFGASGVVCSGGSGYRPCVGASFGAERT